jgi:hypothetical protein
LIIEENINPQKIHKTQTIQIKIKIVGRIRKEEEEEEEEEGNSEWTKICDSLSSNRIQ